MRRRCLLNTLVIIFLAAGLLVSSAAVVPSSTVVQLWIGNASMSVDGMQQPIDAQGTRLVTGAGVLAGTVEHSQGGIHTGHLMPKGCQPVCVPAIATAGIEHALRLTEVEFTHDESYLLFRLLPSQTLLAEKEVILGVKELPQIGFWVLVPTVRVHGFSFPR